MALFIVINNIVETSLASLAILRPEGFGQGYSTYLKIRNIMTITQFHYQISDDRDLGVYMEAFIVNYIY